MVRPSKRPKTYSRSFTIKARYTTHQARSDIGKKITKLIDKIADGQKGVKTIGWTFEEEGSEDDGKPLEIIADPMRYRALSKEASLLLKGSETQNSNFAYSTLRVAKGDVLEDLVNTDTKGRKVLWCWTAAGSTTWMKMDGSKFFNIHSALIEWEGEPKIKFKSSTSDLFGLLFTMGPTMDKASEKDVAQLEEMGMRPRGIQPLDEQSTTSEEVEEEVDPTIDLPPIFTADAWADKPPPQKGEGWWGRGNPIQVQDKYRRRDLQDGAGLCSPGRWHPLQRRLPPTEGLAQEIYKRMKIDVVEWDRKIAEMMTGNLKASPFTESQIEEARRCLMEWAARKGFFAKAG